MEARHIPGKGKRVMMWLRIGCFFSKQARVGYDLAWEDEDFSIDLIYGSHPLVLLHKHNADVGNS